MLGLLDDLLIVPFGIWLVLKLVPAELMAEYRERASGLAERPVSIAGALIVLSIWLLALAILGLALLY